MWVAQWVDEWSVQQTSGVNTKHVDCDGNGVVDSLDLLPILANYGFIHAKTQQSFKGPNDPLLSLNIPQDTSGVSDTIAIPVEFGTMAQPADSVYGLAFSVIYDATLIDSVYGVTVDYGNSWLGTKGIDMITLDTNFYNNGRIDIAMVRTDGNKQSGFGNVCTLNLITIDNLSGKQPYIYETLKLELVDVKVIDNHELSLPYNIKNDSMVIEMLDIVISAEDVEIDDDVVVYPNPASNLVNIKTNQEISNISLYNSVGQLIRTISLNERKVHYSVDLGGLENGVYFINIVSGDRIINKRISIHKK